MKRTIIWIIACSGATLAGQAPDGRRGIDWRADVTLLARELPQRHPDAFHWITRALWDSATGDLDRRLPALTRNHARSAEFRSDATFRSDKSHPREGKPLTILASF